MILTLLICATSTVQGQQRQEALFIPGNLHFSLELLSQLSTASSQKGDKFSCKVLAPVEYLGAVVEGHVRKSKRSGKEKGKSEMDLAFDTITLTNGTSGVFNATVAEVFDVTGAADQGRADSEGTLNGKSTIKRNAIKIGVGTALGAIIGGLLGGGKGAAIGAAIGAGVSATTTLAQRGPDLEFKRGTQFTVITNGPSKNRKGT